MDFEFGKNGTVTSMDVVPEPFRGFYSETSGQDGSFSLVEAFKPAAAALDGINGALRKARTDLKNKPDLTPWTALSGNFDGFEGDVTAETVDAKIKEMKASMTAKQQGATNWDKIRADLEKAHATALQAKDGELSTMQKTLNRYLIGQQATTAIAAEKGVPQLLLPHIESKVKVIKEGDDFVVRVVDAQGDPRGNASGGFMSVADLVKEMKADAIYGRAFESESPGSAGGAPRPGASQRPAGGVQNSGGNRQLTPNEKIQLGLNRRAGVAR